MTTISPQHQLYLVATWWAASWLAFYLTKWSIQIPSQHITESSELSTLPGLIASLFIHTTIVRHAVVYYVILLGITLASIFTEGCQYGPPPPYVCSRLLLATVGECLVTFCGLTMLILGEAIGSFESEGYLVQWIPVITLLVTSGFFKDLPQMFEPRDKENNWSLSQKRWQIWLSTLGACCGASLISASNSLPATHITLFLSAAFALAIVLRNLAFKALFASWSPAHCYSLVAAYNLLLLVPMQFLAFLCQTFSASYDPTSASHSAEQADYDAVGYYDDDVTQYPTENGGGGENILFVLLSSALCCVSTLASAYFLHATPWPLTHSHVELLKVAGKIVSLKCVTLFAYFVLSRGQFARLAGSLFPTGPGWAPGLHTHAVFLGLLALASSCAYYLTAVELVPRGFWVKLTGGWPTRDQVSPNATPASGTQSFLARVKRLVIALAIVTALVTTANLGLSSTHGYYNSERVPHGVGRRGTLNEQSYGCERNFSTFWVHPGSIPQGILVNLVKIQRHFPEYYVTLYCGHSDCYTAAKRAFDAKERLIARNLKAIPQLLGGSPLEGLWTSDPGLLRHKLTLGLEFPRFVAELVRLAVMWRYETGISFDPKTTYSRVVLPSCDKNWIATPRSNLDKINSKTPSLLNIKRNSGFLEVITEEFIRQHDIRSRQESIISNITSRGPYVSLTKLVVNILARPICTAGRCLTTHQLKISQLKIPVEPSYPLKILQHSSEHPTFEISPTLNGDSVLDFVALNLVPSTAGFSPLQHRTNLPESTRSSMFSLSELLAPVTIDHWPWTNPSVALTCAAMQNDNIAVVEELLSDISILNNKTQNYLANPAINKVAQTNLANHKEAFLRKYIAKCSILLLDRNFLDQMYFTKLPNASRTKIITDFTSFTLADALPDAIQQVSSDLSNFAQQSVPKHHTNSLDFSLDAEISSNNLTLRKLRTLANSELVITDSLSSALASAALHIPVVHIDTFNYANDIANTNKKSFGALLPNRFGRRLDTLTDLFHTIRVNDQKACPKGPKQCLNEWLRKLPWNNPPPNPNLSLFLRLRTTLWNVVRQNQAVHNWNTFIGNVPFFEWDEIENSRVPGETSDSVPENGGSTRVPTFNKQSQIGSHHGTSPNSKNIRGGNVKTISDKSGPQFQNELESERTLNLTKNISDETLASNQNSPRFNAVNKQRLKGPGNATEQAPLIFHLIFTTSADSKVGVFRSATSVSGRFNWRHMRSVESIFYHHPRATVMIHSNTLDPERPEFGALRDVGYDLRVKPYNLTQLIRDSPAKSFTLRKLNAARKGQHWYSHETDLLRLLVLHRWGGVYLDTDVIIVRPFDTLPPNALGWETINGSLNGAIMKISSPSHRFVVACLREFAAHYSPGWSDNGPYLLTRVWRRWPGGSHGSGIATLTPPTFYMFHWTQVNGACFKRPSPEIVAEKLALLRRGDVYAVHLNYKLSANKGTREEKGGGGTRLGTGTLCKYLLNEFCILCHYEY